MIEKIIDMFGPCDIQVIVEDTAAIMEEKRQNFLRFVFARNTYHARILKAEEYFSRQDVRPEDKEKQKAKYEELLELEKEARYYANKLEGELPFGEYFIDYDDKNFMKVLCGPDLKEYKFEIKKKAA